MAKTALAEAASNATLADWLMAAERQLALVGFPKSDARILALHALESDWATLLRNAGGAVPSSLHDLLTRRLSGEPIAYIVGSVEFFGLNILTTPAALIPRFETEALVELALGGLPAGPAHVLDIGCGTGAIALALKSQRPSDMVLATDISSQAVELAKLNTAQLKLDIEVVLGNLFEPAAKWAPFDLVVCNPPYIARNDPEVQASTRFEPSLALYAGESGDEVLNRLIVEAPKHLKTDGNLIMECGREDQVHRIHELLSKTFSATGVERDQNQRLRIVWGRK